MSMKIFYLAILNSFDCVPSKFKDSSYTALKNHEKFLFFKRHVWLYCMCDIHLLSYKYPYMSIKIKFFIKFDA